jgi:CP family cyanate transporter-like MFS transporter
VTSGILYPMPDPEARPHDVLAPSAPVLLGLLLVALALRPQLSGIGPLAGDIRDELGASHAFVGLLTTIPVLCMGLFAPFGPSLARAIGTRRAITAAAGTVAVAGLLRALVPGEAMLLALTLLVGVATAMTGPMLAMFVRGRLAAHAVAGTASYAGGTTLGAALASAVAVPLAIAFGGWRPSMAAISVASGMGALVFLRLSSVQTGASAATPADAPTPARGLALPRLPVRRPIVWVIGLLFGLQSCLYYGIAAWLPSVYVERGWDPAAAALLVTVSNVGGLLGTLIAPLASRRGVERRTLLAGASLASLVGLLGVVLVPAPGWAWAVVMGIGLGGMFTMVLTLPTDVAHDAREAGGASALMLLVGYLIASAAPFVLGAARDASGSFASGLWLLVALTATMIPIAWVMAPHRLRPVDRTEVMPSG